MATLKPLLIALVTVVLLSSTAVFALGKPPSLNIDFSLLNEVETPPSISIKLKESTETSPSISISLEKKIEPTTNTSLEKIPRLRVVIPKKIKRNSPKKISRI